MTESQPHLSALPKLKRLLMQLSFSRKIALGLLLISSALLFFIVLYTLGDDDEYRLLYTNLDHQDFRAVGDYLRLGNIDFKEEQQRRSIYVPADLVRQIRLELASQKLPSINGGALPGNRTLSFMESVIGGDPLMVVQHELSKTLAALDHIRAARVHLQFSPDHAAAGSQAGATVLLSLDPGRTLSRAQLQTVIHLVSASVSGLESRDVKVFDNSGNLLSGGAGLGDSVLFTDSTLAHQTSLERRLERKVQELVDAMIGTGQALIRISARLDFSRNETTSERYDPDETVVKSELTERRPLTESGPESTTGLDAAPRSRSSVTTSSQVDYEISKTTSRTLRAAGELTQLAVTILVADQKTTADDGTVSYQPRSDDELEAIRSLVAEALLLNPDRGDKVHLRRMPVERFGTTADPASISPLYQIIDLVPIGKLILLSFIFILFYWLVLKPLITFLRSEIEQAGSDETASEQMTAAMPDAEGPAEDITVKLKEDVQEKPLAAAHIIRRWIHEA